MFSRISVPVYDQLGLWRFSKETILALPNGLSDLSLCIVRLKCDGTRAETSFRLSPKWTSPFKSAGASVQSTAGSRGVRISGSNAGHTTFRGSVRVLATHSIHQFPLHFPSRASPCALRFQTHSTSDRCFPLSSSTILFTMAKCRIKPEFRNVSRIINHRINNPRNELFQKDPSVENEPQSEVYRLNVDKLKRCFPPELAFHFYLLLSPHFQNDRTYVHICALHVILRQPMSDVFEIL